MKKIDQKIMKSLIELYNNSDFSILKKEIDLLLPHNKDSFFLLNLLGTFHARLQNYDDAIKFYKKAMVINPDSAQCHYNIGTTYLEIKKYQEAITSLKCSIKIDDKNPEAYNNIANAYKSLGSHNEAITNFSKAIKLDQSHLKSIYNLAGSLKEIGKYNEAIKYYEKALIINPNYGVALNNLGLIYYDLGRLDDSIKCYKKAIKLNQLHAEPLNNLAIILQEQGILGEARSNFRKAIDIKEDYAEAYRNLSIINRYSSDDPIINKMKNLFGKEATNDNQKMHLGFALGKAFGDLKEYKESFSFFKKANLLKRNMLNYSISYDKDLFTNIKKIFSSDLFLKYKDVGYKEVGPIFIVGMPRSGTSLVEQIISSHKNVSGAGELGVLHELIKKYFFDYDKNQYFNNLKNLEDQTYVNFGKEYFSYTNNYFKENQYITDKMPLNFRWLGLVRLVLPNSTIIHCNRDPKDTCLSIFKNYFDKAGNRYAYDLKELGLYYNLYKKLMEHWNSVIPGWIHNINYEDLIENPEKEIKDMLKRCNLEWDDNCLNYTKNKRNVRTASNYQVRQPIYKTSIKSWEGYKNFLDPLLDILH